MKLVLELSEREIKMLKFITENTFGDVKFSKLTEKQKVDAMKSNIRVAMVCLYKKELGYLHQSEDHDNLPLTKEI